MKLVNIAKLLNMLCSPAMMNIYILTDNADANDTFVSAIKGTPNDIIKKSVNFPGNYMITEMETDTDNIDLTFIPYPGFLKLYITVKEDYSAAGRLTDKKLDEGATPWMLDVYELLIVFRNIDCRFRIKGIYESGGYVDNEFTNLREIISSRMEFYDYRTRYIIPPGGYTENLVILCNISTESFTDEQIKIINDELVENAAGVFDDIDFDPTIF